ncbi:MAG: hypothetical protein ACT4NY_26530 [Pseudonocardiales bacterium]
MKKGVTMAWIDEIKVLVAWLKDGPANDEERSVGAKLFAIHGTGMAFYAETSTGAQEEINKTGFLQLSSKAIAGSLKRYETRDRWNFYNNPGEIFGDWFDNLPFNPEKLEDIGMNIDIVSGVIKVGSVVFPSPESVSGLSLVSAKSVSQFFAGPWVMGISLSRHKYAIPHID